MTYRISYADGWALTSQPWDALIKTEYFKTEYEALGRARELVESGVHERVSLSDSAGVMFTGVRLQLKLGASVCD